MPDIVVDAGAAPAGEPAAAPAPVPSAVPVAPAPQPGAIADLLAQHRSEKAARTQVSKEAEGLRARVAELEGKLAKTESARGDLIGDPTRYLRSLGLTDAELPVVGEAIMYEQMPDRAPPDLRTRMLEVKLRRQEQDRAAADAARREEDAARASEQGLQTYQNHLAAHVDAGGEFPLSTAWFSSEDDPGAARSEYIDSLVHTARNLAHAAQARGEVADLSPQAVRGVLEEWIAKRASRLPGRSPQGVPEQKGGAAQAPAQKNEPPRGVAARDLAGTGAPAKRTNSDADRVSRAKALMETFGFPE